MEDAAPVRADPKIVVAAIKHGVDGLIVDKIIHLDGNVLEALTVESSETGGCRQQQTPSGRCAIMHT